MQTVINMKGNIKTPNITAEVAFIIIQWGIDMKVSFMKGKDTGRG